MYDVIAVGDTTEDVFLEISDYEKRCDDDGENCKLCLDYADKIAVDKKTDVPAVGNAANHAIGIARMGLTSAIYTVVGDDTQGHLALDTFKENGVDTKYVTLDEKRGTNFSVVINTEGERTILVFHEPRDYSLPNLEESKWMYLTSASGDGVEKMHEQVTKFVHDRPDLNLAFNPGTHQMHLGRKKLEPLLAETELLFLNREESAEVLEVETTDIKELAQGFHDIGVKMIVITDGPEGAYVSDGKEIWFAGIFDGPVVERTGCGDSYGSGFLSAIIKGNDIPTAMQWGNANSTSVVQFIGAREGLLTPESAEELIGKNSHVKVEKFA